MNGEKEEERRIMHIYYKCQKRSMDKRVVAAARFLCAACVGWSVGTTESTTSATRCGLIGM